MPPAVVVAGLGCGMVLTVGAAMVRGRAAPAAWLSQAARFLSWLAALLLLAAGAVAWLQSPVLPALAPRLFLVAAVVSPVWHRRRGVASVVDTVLAAAVLFLAGSGLYHAWLPTDSGLTALSTGPQPVSAGLTAIAPAILAGLGIRYTGEAMGRAVGPTSDRAGPPAAVFGLLALIVAILTLSDLWVRGTLRSGSPGYVGIGSAFVAWSAVWLCPRDRRTVYAAVVSGAALLLLWVALALV